MIVIIIKVSKQSNIGLRGRLDDVSLVHIKYALPIAKFDHLRHSRNHYAWIEKNASKLGKRPK